MNNTYQTGAVAATLDVYQKTINELKVTLSDVSQTELIAIADLNTDNPHCRSIQTIPGHVARAGFGYATYIRNIDKHTTDFREVVLRTSINDYKNDLTDMFAYTKETFENINDTQLEQFDNSKKILTSWHQQYDIEQLMEHAIVHIIKHQRQINKFKIILRTRA